MFPRKAQALLLTFLIILSANGQTDLTRAYTQNFAAQSPDAFAFSKIDNIPMNPFTGRVQLNLPLFQKKMSILNFTMNLTYSGAGGMKQSEPATILGRGWMLDVGGIITRDKRGVPDDYQDAQVDGNTGTVPTTYNGVLYNNGINYKADGDQRISSSDPTFHYADGSADSQHDIFEFNIFGRSGKFYIGKDQQVLVVTDSKMQVFPDFTSSPLPEYKLGAFLLVDEMGIKYHFNQVVTGVDPYQSPVTAAAYYNKPYAAEWLLTKVEAPDGEESITYSYNQQNIYGISTGGASMFVRPSNLPNGQSVSLTIPGATAIDLVSIQFSDNTRIAFNYFNSTTTANPLLSGILVTNAQQETTTSYSLTYSRWGASDLEIFTNTTSNPYSWGGRDISYLNKIDQVSNTGNHQTLFAFDYFLGSGYNEVSLPGAGYKSTDYWGYYNGKSNATPFVMPTQWGGAANRLPDINFAQLGALKRIVYATGGSEEFFYELNDRRNGSTNVAVGGMRLSKRVLHDGVRSADDITKQYKYIETDGLSSGFLGEQPQFIFVKNVYYDDGGWPSNPHVEYTDTTCFESPANPLSSVEGSFAGYRRVEELQTSGSTYNGETVYEFSDLTYTSLWTPTDYFPYRPVDRPFWAVGLPLKTTVLSASGTTTKQVVNQYNIVQQAKTDDNYRSLFMSTDGEVDAGPGSDPSVLRYIYKYKNYYPVVGRAELTSSTVSEFPFAGSGTVSHVTTNSYDPSWFVLRSTSQLNSKGENVQKIFHFPFDYNLGSGSFPAQMTSRNIIQQPVLSETYINKSSGSYLVSADVIEQTAINGSVIRPAIVHTSRLDQPVSATPGTFSTTTLLPVADNLQPDTRFNVYDANDRLVEFQSRGGFVSAVIYDQSGNVIASAKNAAFNNIAYSGFETNDMGNWTYSLSGVSTSDSKTGERSFAGGLSRTGLASDNYLVRLWAKGGGSISVNGVSQTAGSSWTLLQWPLNAVNSIAIATNGNLVDDVALFPQTSQMTVYTFKQGLGILSSTDAAGKTTGYEYDEFNRLRNIRDQYGNIIKHYEYQYTAPVTNAAKSAGYTPDASSCPVGNYVPGPPVTYLVPAGRYNSLISQPDADAQANSDLQANGQANADQPGHCIPIFYNGGSYIPFTRDNCPAGTIPGQVYYVVPAGKYSSTISQPDAEAKASADVAANGQHYADSAAGCPIAITVSVSNQTNDDYVISFSGLSASHSVPHNSSPSFVIPAGTYTANISPASSNNVHNFYVGARTAITNTFATFNNVNIGVSSVEDHFGIY